MACHPDAGLVEKAETDAIHAYVIKRAHAPEYIPASLKRMQ